MFATDVSRTTMKVAHSIVPATNQGLWLGRHSCSCSACMRARAGLLIILREKISIIDAEAPDFQGKSFWSARGIVLGHFIVHEIGHMLLPGSLDELRKELKKPPRPSV